MTHDWVLAVSTSGRREIVLPFEEGGHPYIARIVGTHGIWRWNRSFVKLGRPILFPGFYREVRVPFELLGALPAPLDIRWGPRGKDGECELRRLFMATKQDFYVVDDATVLRMLAGLPAVEVTTTPRRRGERAPITFEEEV